MIFWFITYSYVGGYQHFGGATASTFYPEGGEKRFFWNDGNLIETIDSRRQFTLQHTPLYSVVHIFLHLCTVLFILLIILHVNMYRRHGARYLFLNSRQIHAIEIYCFITAFFSVHWTMMASRTGRWYTLCLQQMVAMPPQMCLTNSLFLGSSYDALSVHDIKWQVDSNENLDVEFALVYFDRISSPRRSYSSSFRCSPPPPHQEGH